MVHLDPSTRLDIVPPGLILLIAGHDNPRHWNFNALLLKYFLLHFPMRQL